PLETGVKQPEAAGAIAWLLYNAFVETGDLRYRQGAEWALEFLSGFSTNAAYELQLPYGVYTAARMNAELGTNYDVDKMLNWCFDHEDNVREWGVTLGNWGGYDCDGLVGVARYDEYGYAFFMNGVEQFGALVPMVRYDDRFARAIGKWALNVANASRLFYTNYLPDSLQDSKTWALQYDPNSYIAYEALREDWMGISPYATGDNWGATNLSLYGASHVGIFGGIIDTTNIEGILRLDVLKTDYFHNEAYTTFLYYNPYDEEKIVELEAGWGTYDLYDAVGNEFIKYNVSGIDSFSIASDAAMLTVLIPPGSEINYDLDKAMIGNVVIDYLSGQTVGNYPPRIKSLAADTTTVCFGKITTLYCSAEDRDTDELFYEWNTSGGLITGDNATVTWAAPGSEGNYFITCIADDGNDGKDSAEVSIEVVESINHAPVITKITATPGVINLGGTSEITCTAEDPDGDTLDYYWFSEYGNLNYSDSIANWTAPEIEGYYFVICEINDGHGGEDIDSVGIVVHDTSNSSFGTPIAYYPFNGNANDES
ncbi:MAG: laminin G, partial [Candidatus Marinimicrobia bacterium]|nr:laminin G [Candidatus Neomarinimicrobiota bacterium]